MRTFLPLVLSVVTPYVFSPLFGQLSYTSCGPDPLTGQTSTVFDWRTEFFFFYMEGETQVTQVVSPFWINTSTFQENVSHLGSVIAQDFEPDDGWELILANFGTVNQKVEMPTLILYNRLNGIMRVFLYAKGDIETYQSATVELSYYVDPGGFQKNTAALEHMSTPMNALDNFTKGTVIDFPNKYYNFVSGSSNRTWLFGEFVTAYDPCSCSHSTGIKVQPNFAQIVSIDLNLSGQGTTVPVYTPSEPRNGFSAALSTSAGFVETLAKGGKTYSDLGKFTDFLEDLGWGINAANLPVVGTAISTFDNRTLFAASCKREIRVSSLTY